MKFVGHVNKQKLLLVLLLCSVPIYFGLARWLGPKLEEHEWQELKTARRHELFFEQVPILEGFLFTSLGFSGKYSVERTAWGAEDNYGLVCGHYWSVDQRELIGNYTAHYMFDRGESKPMAVSWTLQLSKARVMATLNDPIPRSVAPRHPRAELKVQSKPEPFPFKSLGGFLVSELRSLAPGEFRQVRRANADVSLYLDMDQNLAITVQSELPNPFMPPEAVHHGPADLSVNREVVPKVRLFLKNAILPKNAIVGQEVSSGRGVHRYKFAPMIRFTVQVRGGPPLRVTFQPMGRDQYEYRIWAVKNAADPIEAVFRGLNRDFIEPISPPDGQSAEAKGNIPLFVIDKYIREHKLEGELAVLRTQLGG